MNEHDIATRLQRVQAPAPDPLARARARRAALAEFARSQAANQARIGPAAGATNNLFERLCKDLQRRLRPSRDNTLGSASMNWFRNRGLLAGAAGVCVVALGVAIVLPNRSLHRESVGQPATAAEAGRAPVAAVAELLAEAPEVGVTEARPTPDARVRQDSAASVTLDLATSSPGTVPPMAAPAPPMAGDVGELVVSGSRGNVSSMEMRREPIAVDAISAEDIGRAPDRKLAKNYQQIPGVTLAGSKPAGVSVQRAVVVPMPPPAQEAQELDEGRDRFQNFELNPIRRVDQEPVSTFSADVDTASYSFVRSMLNHGRLPQKDAVRSEEMINYFDYAWPAAKSRGAPFEPTVVVSDSPWNKGKKLVHIGIKGFTMDRRETPDANLVLLLDVSGSMDQPNKLPLAVRSMELLLESLKPSDTIGIVVYAGAAGTVLEPTPVRERSKILEALRSLRPGGSTAGAEGIERAYELAERHFRKGGVNRILLATDGDFNVGIDDTNELKGFVERKREKGIYLSVLGFGQGNYRDELAQALAQNGNGVAAYIDTENEARKVLVQEASGSLFTIAKDVKLQVEFNPATVSEYRLVGYETRALRREDFNNDAIDAGDVGAGHTVTAIYEITPAGVAGSIDQPRYEGNRGLADGKEETRASRDEYGFLKIRYKLPDEDKSRLISEAIPVRGGDVPAAIARDVSFSTAVAGFAQLLRGGQHTGALSYEDVARQAQAARGEDRFGHRAEFIELVRKAQSARGM
jgi:Ca-activated chloride channel family protein